MEFGFGQMSTEKWLEREWTIANQEVKVNEKLAKENAHTEQVFIYRMRLNYWIGYLDAITNTQNEQSGMSEE